MLDIFVRHIAGLKQNDVDRCRETLDVSVKSSQFADKIRVHLLPENSARTFVLENGKELLYFTDSNCIYDPRAIQEMLEMYEYVNKHMGELSEIAMTLYDNPKLYEPNNIVPSYIVPGKYRHWRTSQTGNSSLLVSRALFDRWAEEILVGKTETIWNHPEGARLFSPLRTLVKYNT